MHCTMHHAQHRADLAEKLKEQEREEKTQLKKVCAWGALGAWGAPVRGAV
jgi:hypothetical protein